MLPDRSKKAAPAVSVTLADEDIEHVRRLLSKIVRTADRRQILEGAYAIDGTAADLTDGDPRETLALQLFAVQQARNRILPSTTASEVAWDILVTLYLAERSGVRHTIGRVIKLAQCSLATGLRHIGILQQEGLLEREQSSTDGRVFHLLISKKGREAVDAILSAAVNPRDPLIM